MNINELIVRFKQEAIDNMVKNDVLASVQLAYIIANNTDDNHVLELFEEISNRKDIRGIKNYREACKVIAKSNKEKNKLVYIIENNKLYTYDSEALDKKEEVIGSSIEIDVENTAPAIEVYSVKESAESESSLYNTNDIREAKDKCKKGYSVFDSKGRVVYTIPDEPPVEIEEPEPIADQEEEEEKPNNHRKALVNGTHFRMNNVKAYRNPYTANVREVISGSYYITDETITNDRIRVAPSRYDLKTILYVNIEDLSY